jgi:hypothetical protein
MKKLIFSALSLFFTVFVFVSCDDTFTDLMTADVKTGGMLDPTGGVPYKLGGTPSFDISITIPKGPGINAVEIYRTYTDKTVTVLDQTIDIGSANETDDVIKTVNFTYAKLIDGLGMPEDESLLTIGDAWTLSYKSVMPDGRKVDVASKTTITVANKYAGYYQCVGVFSHPTAGDRPINEEKYLTPIDANSCWGPAGDLGGSGYFVRLTINPADNTVICSKWDAIEMINVPGEPNYWDPATGVFHLAYFYVGGTGNRVMRETWTPK